MLLIIAFDPNYTDWFTLSKTIKSICHNNTINEL